jgi:hypothetical protein
MSEKTPQSIDVLGIKPVGEAINTLVKGAVDGASAFLSRICLPASEEFGLLLRDKVGHWRAINLVKIAEKTERKLNAIPKTGECHAHPRIASLILEHSSWVDTDEIQDMWAGLLASSCTEDGKDDSNLIFINLLSQLSTLQVRVLNFACEKAEKKVSPVMSLVYAESIMISPQELANLTGINDLHRIDRELDHLAALDLIRGGFPLFENEEDGEELLNNALLKDKHLYTEEERKVLVPDFNASFADIAPSPLAINLYVRAQGSFLSPVEFFGLSK